MILLYNKDKEIRLLVDIINDDWKVYHKEKLKYDSLLLELNLWFNLDLTLEDLKKITFKNNLKEKRNYTDYILNQFE